MPLIKCKFYSLLIILLRNYNHNVRMALAILEGLFSKNINL